ncbi:MAG TPA: PKD domain-containing protein, partial [Solirubrobacterales bacterium]|nr:PKD domain-containing protein [Solirubrobacterales bacterium]
AFSLAVTPIDRVRLAASVEGASGSPLGGPRVFLTSLGPSSTANGAKAVGPELADGSGVEGVMNLAFTAGGSVRSIGVETQGKLEPGRTLGGVGAVAGSPVVATLGPEGGGVIAYEGVDESGSPTVVVRQEFPEGELQTGLLYGPLGGPISALAGAGSGEGDALIAFSQGESGQSAIVADRISAPPEAFSITVPEHWVRPTKAKVNWAPPSSAVGGLTYTLLVDGRVVRSGLTDLRVTPPAALLGSGTSKVRVLATDRLGGEVLSRAANLRVDARPPAARLALVGKRGAVVLRVSDAQSGLAAGSIRVNFGDGSHARGHATIHHRYLRSGRYTVRVRAKDRVGNRLVQRVEVKVR